MADLYPPPELEPFSVDGSSLQRPLEIFLAEHMRQNAVCRWLETCADREEVAQVAPHADPLLRFLTADLVLHFQDEEHDLFPLLRERCPAEDEVDRILDQLSAEHMLDRDLTDFLVEDLQALSAHVKMTHGVRLFINLKAFAITQMRHLAWENSTVLPLAQRRLTEDDMEALAARMAARRGIELAGP